MRILFAQSCGLMALLALAASPATGDDADTTAQPLTVGGRPPAGAVAAFAQGAWRQKQRSACPILLQRNDPKVAIYTRQLDAASLSIAKAIDQLITQDASLQWSFMMIDNSKSPKGVLDARLALTKTVAKQNNINHLSLGLFSNVEDSAKGQNTRGLKQLKFFGDADIVVSLVLPAGFTHDSGQSFKWPTIAYVRAIKSGNVDEDAIAAVVAEIRARYARQQERITKQ